MLHLQFFITVSTALCPSSVKTAQALATTFTSTPSNCLNTKQFDITQIFVTVPHTVIVSPSLMYSSQRLKPKWSLLYHLPKTEGCFSIFL